MMCSGIYKERNYAIDLINIRLLNPNETICGVYGISGADRTILVNTSLYVGSSKDCVDRKNNGHLYLIQKEKHCNLNLQRAVLKDGIENFKFFLLEETAPEIRIEREQNWLDYYNSLNQLGYCKILFNISETAGKPSHNKKSIEKMRDKKSFHWIVTDTNGIEINTNRLKDLCKTNNLIYECMIQVSTGRISHHRGWLCRNAKDEKQPYTNRRQIGVEKRKRFYNRYIITYPNGNELEIADLGKFCEDNKLNKTAMYCVARGRRKSHKNFKCKFAPGYSYKKRRNQKNTFLIRTKQYIITFPDGHEEKIDNLSMFCKKFNLLASKMSNIAKGFRETHKGFKCRFSESCVQPYIKQERKKRNQIVLFISPDNKTFEVKNCNLFCKEHGLDINCVSQTLKGRQKQHKGWMVRYKLE